MVTDFLKAGWKAYKRSFWPVIGATLIVTVVSLLLGMGALGVLFIEPLAMAAPDPQAIAEAFVPMTILFVILGVVLIELSGGITGVYAEALKRRAKVGTLFSTIQRLWLPILEVAIVIALSFLLVFAIAIALFAVHPALGAVVGIAGFLALPFRLVLAEAAVVVSRYPPRKALSTSWNVVGKNYLSFLALVLLIVVIALLITLIPIIGSIIASFVVAPVGGIAIVQFYIKNLKKR